MDAELARQRLAQSGFDNIHRVTVYSSKIAKGHAVGTLPASGQRVRVTDELTLQISKGPPPVAIPDLHGQKLSDAQKALKDLGFKTTVTHDFSVDVPKGYVIGTRPPKGEKLQIGKTVTLVVSKGPRTFPMPNVVLESVAQAKAQLEKLGLIVQTVVTGSGNSLVVGQNPGCGDPRPRGTDRQALHPAVARSRSPSPAPPDRSSAPHARGPRGCGTPAPPRSPACCGR